MSHKNNPIEQFVQHLDMEGVDGVSCKTVHPMIGQVFKKLAGKDPNEYGLSPLQEQIAACLCSQCLEVILDDLTPLEDEDGVLFLISPSVMYMSMVWIARLAYCMFREIAPRFEQPKWLKLLEEAQRMHEYITQSCRQTEAPLWLGEVEAAIDALDGGKDLHVDF